MFRYTHYLGPEKLKRAIWCELFVIHKGYLPYLKKWAKLQDQTRAEVRADPDDNKTCKDLQPLAPCGPLKFGDSLMIQPTHLETRIRDSQDYSQIHAEDEVL